jgi:hypothetical protein
MHLNGVLDLERFLLVVYVVVSKVENDFYGFYRQFTYGLGFF